MTFIVAINYKINDYMTKLSEISNNKITVAIGEAIKKGKYLSITYKNLQGEVKPFWISIMDITYNGKIVVDMFNPMKEEPLIKRMISISGIQTADILKFSVLISNYLCNR